MRHDALIIRQRVTAPGCYDALKICTAEGRRRVGVCLARVVVRAGDTGSKHGQPHNHRTHCAAGENVELLHATSFYDLAGLLHEHCERSANEAIEASAGKP